MKKFKYKARTAEGVEIKGEVEAGSDKSAAKLLKRKGYIVISLVLKKDLLAGVLKGIKERVTSKDVVNFTRQMATMINAGLPLTDSLTILRNQSTGRMQVILSEVLTDVEGGQSLSSSLSKYPDVFNKTYISLIKSGEMGGVLDKVLEKLSEGLEKQQDFQSRVKGAMVYPTIIFVGMVAVMFVMMIFVIPRMMSLYDQFDAELPATTKLLMSVSSAMSKYWILIITAGVSILYIFKGYIKTKEGKRRFDRFKLRIPLVGELQRQVILTDFSRTMALMVNSRVSILDGLYICSEVAGNSVISDALVDAAKMVEKGFPVAFSFAKHPEAFPAILSQMISVGEETGKMDEVLEKISRVFESESDQKLKAITASIEPIILIFLGVGVAFLVVSVIMPIYNLTNQL